MLNTSVCSKPLIIERVAATAPGFCVMLVLWGPTWAELMVDDMVIYWLVFSPQMVVNSKGNLPNMPLIQV